MSNLNVTLVQTQQFWEDKQANLNHLDKVLTTIGKTDLIVLPEMFNTSFSMNAEILAEEMADSEALLWLKKAATEKSCAIYTSFIVKDKGHFYNRGIFMLPSGEYTKYDKRQLFSLAGEDQIFSPGKDQVIVEYKDWKILLQICYDLRFPEIQRNGLDRDGKPVYDLLLTIANWPKSRSLHWKTLLSARAIENQCYVVGVNRVGQDGKGLEYTGDSAVIDLLGHKTALESGEDNLISSTLNKDTLNEMRRKIPFLKDISLKSNY